jgi:hypothetical protein
MRKLAVVLLALACTKSEPAPPAQPAAPAAAPAPTVPVAAPPAAPAGKPAAPDDPAKAVEQFGQQMGQAMGSLQKPGAKAVNWRELVALLGDDLGGWKATAPAKGETNTMGQFSITEASRHYKNGDVSAHVKITDTSMNSMLVAGWRMARSVTQDSSEHYQKPIDIAGQPGIEEWSSSKHGKIQVLAADRFLIDCDASGVPDTKGLAELCGKLDMGKLASLAK